MVSMGKLEWCQAELQIVYGREDLEQDTSKNLFLQYCSACRVPTLP